jgi:hypothetical protein
MALLTISLSIVQFVRQVLQFCQGKLKSKAVMMVFAGVFQ